MHMVGYLGPVAALLLISLLSLVLHFNNLIKKTRLQWNKMLAKYFSYLGKQWVASAVGFILFMVIIYCQLLIQGCPKTGLCLVLFLLFCLGADGLFQSSGKERSRSFCDSSSSKPQRGTCFAPDPASAPGFRALILLGFSLLTCLQLSPSLQTQPSHCHEGSIYKRET